MMEKDELSVQVRVRLFGACSVEYHDEDGTWKTVMPHEWGGTTHSRRLLSFLLLHGRSAGRGTLMEQLWPGSDSSALEGSLNKAVSNVRKVFRADWLLTINSKRTIYQLADQSQVWADVDAYEAALQQAEQCAPDSLERSHLLEVAQGYFEQGPLLDGEADLWCHARRERFGTAYYRCLLSLIEAYEAQGNVRQAEAQVEKLLQKNPLDETALYYLMQILQRQGLATEALRRYNSTISLFKKQGISLSPDIEILANQLLHNPHLRAKVRSAHVPSLGIQEDLAAFTLQLEEEQTMDKSGRGAMQDPFLFSTKVDFSRRQMLYGMLTTACTSLTLSPYTFLEAEKKEHLLLSTQKPSYLDITALADLSEITGKYWKLSANISLQLLQGISGHFQTIMQLLHTPQPASLSQRLYSLSSEIAQLLGKILFDLRDYSLAFSYYTFALKAALEAHNRDLWATALGRMGLLLLSNNQPERALSLLQEGQSVSLQSKKVRAWCTAIEAEAYSYTGDAYSCTKKIEQAKDISEDVLSEPDPYATGLTWSRLASYEGSCYLRLKQPEHALPILEQALERVDPAAVRKLSRLLVYLGEAHTLSGNVQQACEYASQALDLTRQTHSLDILQRVHLLSVSLAAKGITPTLKSLEGKIQDVQMVITSVRGLS